MTLTGRDDSRTTQTNERKKCNNIPRSKKEVFTTDIRTNVDNARELTNGDGSLRSVTNRHQFGDPLRIGYIGQPCFLSGFIIV